MMGGKEGDGKGKKTEHPNEEHATRHTAQLGAAAEAARDEELAATEACTTASSCCASRIDRCASERDAAC